MALEKRYNASVILRVTEFNKQSPKQHHIVCIIIDSATP